MMDTLVRRRWLERDEDESDILAQDDDDWEDDDEDEDWDEDDL